ncbi:hypothetical protein Tco_1077122 [Tanacetum coccineum]
MELCTNLQNRVIDLENIKTSQVQDITSLKLRVKKLEKKGGSRTHKLKRLYKVGRSARVVSSKDAGLGDQEDPSKQERKIDDIDKDKEITLVDETQRRYGDDIMFDVSVLAGEEVFVAEQGVRDSKKDDVVKDKGKGIMVEEPAKIKKKDQISFDKQEAIRLQAEFDEEEKLAREKDEANEQEELTDEEKARLFVQFLEQRRKYFAAKRAEEKRNKPPTKAQQRSIMCTYLKNMEGWKSKSLKSKSFANIQELFDKAFKRSSSKRAGEELEQESSKKQKLEEDKESEELKKCLEIVPDDGDDVTIDATPLSIKSPTIMLKNFDREDLEVLWRIVEARFKKTKPMNYMDDFLLLNLKTMFEHHVEYNVWKKQQGLAKVLNWKLYDSYEVYCVTM